jgi:tetratricopeptide (TPR) repeat protein
MDEATLRGWTEAFQEGATAQGEGRLSAALAAYEKAMQWDGAHAELVYRHARVLAALGREAEAAAGFARARDLDVLRFRADSRLNRIARDTAAREGATLVDLERVLGSTSDSALFLDHVHFTLDGLYRVSREIARGLETWIGPLEIPDRETLFNRLFVTAWSERKHAAIMAQRRARPPFAAQWGNREKLDALNAQMARSTAAIATSDLHRVESAYRELCHEYPDDANYGLQWGQMLCVAHEWEWAARVYGDAIENIHGYSDAHHQAAVALGQAGRPAEAARILLKPGKPYGHYLADFTMLLIQALEKSGQETDARTAAEAVLAGAGRFPGRERVEAWRRKE